MAGIGQADNQALAIHPGPLVTPADPNIVSSDAVTKLVDAYHKGFVNMDDIISRVDEGAQLKKRATVQELGEFVSPDAIKARVTALHANTAQNQMGLDLVGPQTDSMKWKIDREKWNTVFNGGVDSYQQFGPWFGHGEVPMKPDGSPDFQEMGRVGQAFKTPVYMAEMAQRALKVARTEPTVDKRTGKEGKISYNDFGVDISPGSVGEAHYRSLMSMLPGVTPPANTPPPPVRGVPIPSSSPVQPLPVQSSVTPASAASLVTPKETAPAAAAPMVEPALGGYDPALGHITTSGFSKTETRATLDKNQSFKLWEANKPNIDAFHNIVHTLHTTNDEQTRLEAERGLIYTLSELQQNQANGTIPRGVLKDWEEIVAKQPIEGKIKNIIGKATGHSPLAESQVNALIALGKSAIKSKTSAARDALKFAHDENPESLQDDEKRLLETNGESETSGERAFGVLGKAADAVKSGDLQPASNAGAGEARVIRGVTRYATGKKDAKGWPLYSLTPP